MENIIKNEKLFLNKTTRNTDKMLRNEIIYFKEIYKFTTDHFFIVVLSLVYYWKNVIENKKNTIRNTIKISGTKFISDHFFDQTTSFGFNYNKMLLKMKNSILH